MNAQDSDVLMQRLYDRIVLSLTQDGGGTKSDGAGHPDHRLDLQCHTVAPAGIIRDAPRQESAS
jgi:hypothetical protein